MDGAQALQFLVEGSQGDEYVVSFGLQDGEATSSCSCMAGRFGRFCRHRIALLDGDVSDLLSGNEQQVVQLRGMIEGTDLELAYREAVAAAAGGRKVDYRALEQASRPALQVKAKVRVVADIAGTGIKAGMVGKVVETQSAGARGSSWTDLAPAAVQVKFLKDDLKEWADRQPETPARLPIGAELWLKVEEVEAVDEAAALEASGAG